MSEEFFYSLAMFVSVLWGALIMQAESKREVRLDREFGTHQGSQFNLVYFLFSLSLFAFIWYVFGFVYAVTPVLAGLLVSEIVFDRSSSIDVQEDFARTGFVRSFFIAILLFYGFVHHILY